MGGYSCDLITTWLPFEGDTNKGTPVIIMILMFVTGGTKLEPEGLQELKLIGKNDRLNVSPGNIVFTNVSSLRLQHFAVFLHYRTACFYQLRKLHFNLVSDQVSWPCGKRFQGGVDWISNKDTCTPVNPEEAPWTRFSERILLTTCLPESIGNADADQ